MNEVGTPVQAGDEAYPIRTVSSLTGVNAVTLRAWERRYGLIKPVRTTTGHRLYTREQIDLISHVVDLLGRGMSIGQVAPALRARGEDVFADLRGRMLDAIARFDGHTLEAIYSGALALHPMQTVLTQVLLPLFTAVGERWSSGVASVAQEHFFSVFVRNKIGALMHHRGPPPDGPRLLCACLPAEQHEIGLLLFALAAHDAGYACVVLGAGVPPEELVPAARSAGARAVVLSGSVDPPPDFLAETLARLVRSAHLPVFAGGSAVTRLRTDFEAAGAIALGADIAGGLQRIRTVLAAGVGAHPRRGRRQQT